MKKNDPIRLALIGKDISHSKSPELYRQLLNRELSYDLLDFRDTGEIPSLDYLKNNYNGVSITAPYKTHFLQNSQIKKNEIVETLNVMNTIYFEEELIKAANTDYLALEELLGRYLKQYCFEDVIVLGDGSMAKCVVHLLQKSGLNFTQYSRRVNGDIAKLNLSLNFNHPILVINTCSRAFHFNGILPAHSLFWDLNYNVDKFDQQNVHYIDGLPMLKLQAKFALELWHLT